MMHGHGKSDPNIVAEKPANNAEQSAAELVEPRAGTKGKAGQQSPCRAQDRENVSQALDFQLPTISAPPIAPNSRSVKRDNPLHITKLPGAGSLARFR
jgi:hypothetical protein